MSYPLRAIGEVGILLAIGTANLGFPWYVAAIGATLCILFLVAFVRELVGRVRRPRLVS